MVSKDPFSNSVWMEIIHMVEVGNWESGLMGSVPVADAILSCDLE